jgi:hypothetical protein
LKIFKLGAIEAVKKCNSFFQDLSFILSCPHPKALTNLTYFTKTNF